MNDFIAVYVFILFMWGAVMTLLILSDGYTIMEWINEGLVIMFLYDLNIFGKLMLGCLVIFLLPSIIVLFIPLTIRWIWRLGLK